MENKYKEGEIVYALENPTVKLKIRRYVHRIYYCLIDGNANHEEKVYFEREITNHIEH